MPQGQPIDSQQTDGRASQFQRRWEAIFHWRGMASMLLGSPVLRSAWPMSSVNNTAANRATDISGQGYHLDDAGGGANVQFGSDTVLGIAPVAYFGATPGDYLRRADAGAGDWADIRGNEGYIFAAQRGLTIGLWIYPTNNPFLPQFVMGKADLAGNDQYRLGIGYAILNRVDFTVWPGPVQHVFPTDITLNAWNHIIGRYDQPSQTLFITMNGTESSGAAGAAPALLPDTGAFFTIGASAAGTNPLVQAYGSDALLCAASLRSGFIKAGYHYTKAAYGVK